MPRKRSGKARRPTESDEENPLRLQPEPAPQPGAEQIFASHPVIEVSSAGTNHDAENPVTGELVAWADLIFVMERAHRNKLQKRFRSSLNGKRVLVLDIPDDYAFMDPDLITLLNARMARHLPAA